jgi:hypothetical protein
MGNRTTHADALHQAGRRAEAEARFREAEQMQAERQPEYPLLYSLAGFRYCDLLLTAAERAAWQTILGRAELPLRPDIGAAQQRRPTGTEVESCRAVSERAAQTLKWVTEGNLGLLTIALDHLTLGRAALYAAILEGSAAVSERPAAVASPGPDAEHNPTRRSPLAPAAGGPADTPALQAATTEIDAALSGLRRAGQQHLLVVGLLTRAWQRSLTGVRTGPESAQSDLDEAWEIAARGPMPLFLADIHLHRARLFGSGVSDLGSGEKYPWESPQRDFAEARRLIEQHGYLRRLPELEAAEATIVPA